MAKTEENGTTTAKTPRKDGRRATLFYMKPEVIEAVKDAAQAGDMKAWQLVERAVLREPAVIKALKAKKSDKNR